VLRRFSLAVFFSAFGLRLLVAWKARFFRNFQTDEMVRIALSLVKYHEYGNPYLIRTGPTAHEMPIYLLFLSLIYFVFHTGSRAEAVKIILACAATALRCELLPPFCGRQVSDGASGSSPESWRRCRAIITIGLVLKTLSPAVSDISLPK
jgi:hypothetical protein